MPRNGKLILVSAALPVLALGLTACSGAGGGGGGSAKTINVLMVNNPQMVDLQKLTADNFTKDTGITVNYTVLPENDVRDKISQEFSSQAGQYDVATISNFEVPFYAKNGWLHPLDDYTKADSGFDQADILKPITESLTAEDGKLYGEPFYGESSFLMYRKDVLDAAGVQMPAHPTWQQVADIAAKVDGAQPGMAGICLRGQPGWGQVVAPLTTVVNTFGGTWFDADWTPQVNGEGFRTVVPYLRGYHPETVVPGRGYGAATTAADALRLLDSLGEQCAVLIGHDWGASIAYAVAHLHPERARAIVPIAIPPPHLLRPTPGLLFRTRHFLALRRAITPRMNCRFVRMSFSTEPDGASHSNCVQPSKPMSASASTTAVKSILPWPR